MFVKNGPNTRDAALLVSTLFAAAAATATSNALNLGQARITNPRFEVEVNVDALPNLVAGQSASLKFQDSADGVSFADIGVGFTITGAVGGTAAISRRFGLASTTRQYLQLVAAEPAGGGDLTAAHFSFQLVFWTI